MKLSNIQCLPIISVEIRGIEIDAVASWIVERFVLELIGTSDIENHHISNVKKT